MLENISKKRVVKYLNELELNTNITYKYQISLTLFIYLMITQIILKQVQNNWLSVEEIYYLHERVDWVKV